MSEQKALTADEYESWLTPKEALEILEPHFEEYGAITKLILRLKSGQLLAAASSRFIEPDNLAEGIQPVPIGVWNELDDAFTDPFWRDGDLTVAIASNRGLTSTNYNYLGVRLDVAAVQAMVPVKRTIPVPGAKEEPKTVPKGNPPSRAKLARWFGVYSQMYTGANDTEDNAFASARAMFPGNHVTRDSIRNLRGPQKRGKKPRDLPNSTD